MQLNYKHCLVTLLIVAMKKPNRIQLRKYLSNKKLIIGVLGLLIAFLSIIAYLLFPSILKLLIQRVVNLEKGGEFYNWWSKPSVPTEVGIYFFHIENPYEVQNGHKNIKVKEMGKYMFKQHYERQIVGFSPNLETITFYEKRTYVFDAEQTIGSLDDNITVINAPFAALGSIIPKVIDHLPFPPIISSLPYRGVNRFLESHKQTLFINTTIRDLIYGYRLDLLDTFEGFSQSFQSFGISNIMPTDSFPNNSFGILNGRNGSRDGPFEMYTGLSGTRDLFGHFKSWNNQTQLKWWKSDKCNAIKGTDGTIWPPFVDKKDKLYFFVPDVCRSIYVSFEEESEYKGIKTYKYSAPNEVLAGIDDNPENECFCMDSDRDRCRLNGIYDMSSCQSDIPIIVSLPHFLGADPIITDRIEGLKPDPKIHRPVIHVEPTLGAVIHGDGRLQMAIRVPKNPYIRGFENLDSDLYVPLFWGYKKLGISDDYAAELKSRLFTPVIIIRYVIIMAFITGLLMFFASIFVNFLCKTQVHSISFVDESEIPQNYIDSNIKDNSINSQSLELESLIKESPETIL